MNLSALQLAHLLAFTLPKPLAWVGTILTVVAVFGLFAWYKWTQLSKTLDELFEWELGPERDSKGKTDFRPSSGEAESKALSADPVGDVLDDNNTTKGGGVTSRRPTL